MNISAPASTAHTTASLDVRRLLAFWPSLVVSIAVAFAAAAMGGWLTSLSLDSWYRALAKPSWNPPNWIFGPVWSLLYLMMALAAWLIWIQPASPLRTRALVTYGFQLALNVCWSGMFFALRSPAGAMVDIVLLWLAIASSIALFAPLSRVAAAMMLPYLAWVSFASALNGAIWWLNR